MKPATFNCTPPPFCKALLAGKAWTVEVAREGWTVDTGWTKGGHSEGPGRQKSTAGVVAHALHDTHAKEYICMCNYQYTSNKKQLQIVLVDRGVQCFWEGGLERGSIRVVVPAAPGFVRTLPILPRTLTALQLGGTLPCLIKLPLLGWETDR